MSVFLQSYEYNLIKHIYPERLRCKKGIQNATYIVKIQLDSGI